MRTVAIAVVAAALFSASAPAEALTYGQCAVAKIGRHWDAQVEITLPNGQRHLISQRAHVQYVTAGIYGAIYLRERPGDSVALNIAECFNHLEVYEAIRDQQADLNMCQGIGVAGSSTQRYGLCATAAGAP